MDTDKFPMDPKYVKLDKGDSDEHINVENSVTTDPSVSGSNDNLSDVIPDSENEYSKENTNGDDMNVVLTTMQKMCQSHIIDYPSQCICTTNYYYVGMI